MGRNEDDRAIHIPAGLILDDGVRTFRRGDVSGSVIPGTGDDGDEIIDRLAEAEAGARGDGGKPARRDVEAVKDDGSWGIAAIRRGSPLSILLDAWYGGRGLSVGQGVRSAVVTGSTLYFVIGFGYDVIDRDLLGGNGDGSAVNAFEDMAADRAVIDRR